MLSIMGLFNRGLSIMVHMMGASGGIFTAGEQRSPRDKAVVVGDEGSGGGVAP